MMEGGADYLTSLIKQHKWFDSQAVATPVVYGEHKIPHTEKNKDEGIRLGLGHQRI